MKYILCAVLDRALNAHGRPVPMANELVACRGFRDECLKEDSPFRGKPEDFALARVGDYDEDGGVVSPRYVILMEATACYAEPKRAAAA